VSGSRRLLVLLAKVVVSVGLLALLISRMDTSRFWAYARTASPVWLLGALGIYLAVILTSAWRWGLLLGAQQIRIPGAKLVSSYLVATFFNNFLPSNIGGDVIRIKDTAPEAGSKTLSATVVLIDRGIGLIGLVLVAALGASATAGLSGNAALPILPWVLWAGLALAAALSAPAVLAPAGVGRLLQPLRVFHPEWVGERILRVTDALARFRERPDALLGCFAGAVMVQALLVGFYVAIARSMHIPIAPWHLAVIVPASFLVQMLPISVNGFGVREATFTFCFARLGLPLESALVVSFVGAALVMLFSLSGVPVYLTRQS
jgi:glycosyltransferase 2 family protein